MVLTHIVTVGEAGLTLHQLLRGPMGLSGRQTRNAKAQGAVTVDAAPFFSNQKLSEGMVVRVTLDGYAGQKACAAPQLPPVEIVYEDDALIAVCKPALLQCHPSPSAPGGSDTLEARVTAHLGFPAHPVHRLDSETTGLVLFAKLPFAQAHLQQQMQAGSFSKQYEACWANPLYPWAKSMRPSQESIRTALRASSPLPVSTPSAAIRRLKRCALPMALRSPAWHSHPSQAARISCVYT